MGSEPYDVAVLGAGPAGSTAAILLAQKERRVVLVDEKDFPRSDRSLGWMNARVASLLTDLGAKAKEPKRQDIKAVRFLSGDFSKSAQPTFEDVPGYLIDRVELCNGLVSAASRAGVEIVQGCKAKNVVLRESSVVTELADGRCVDSRLLILASGWESPLLDRVGLPPQRGGSKMWTAQVEAPLDSTSKSGEPNMVVILGIDPAGSFGQVCSSADRVSIAISWFQEPDTTLGALSHLCRSVFENGVVPIDLSRAAVATEVEASPAAAAIDMESHVGKHTLLIGDAGGFVAALSNEGIYPAMWSAQIAADVATEALSSVHSQDALMGFDTQWRMQMADYMRAPSSDSQFLIPLVFSNQPLTDRMGAAFFHGANI